MSDETVVCVCAHVSVLLINKVIVCANGEANREELELFGLV